MVDSVEIGTVLVTVIEAATSDLGELAGSVEAERGKWITGRGVDAPVGPGR